MKKQRFRILFSKTNQMRFTGHLDLILTWERTFRRAGLPLAYSEGFSPRPLINLAAPLPLSFTSTGEIGDFWLSEIISLEEFQLNLKRALPPGLELNNILELADLHGPKLPSLVTAASYKVKLMNKIQELLKKVENIKISPKLMRIRKGKSYDLRPLIKKLEVSKNGLELIMTLEMLPGATGRPDEVLEALEISPATTQISRSAILLVEEAEN